MLNVNEKKEKTPAEIGKIGEEIVAAILKGNGYSTKVNTQLPGATDIEATGKEPNLLVQVKTGVEPNAPVSLSADEETAIKQRAGLKKWWAYEYKVQLDKDYKRKSVSRRFLYKPEEKKS